MVAVAPPDAVIESPAANSDPEPFKVEGPICKVEPPDPDATANIVATDVLPPLPFDIVLPTANVPETDSTAICLIALLFTAISVKGGM